MAQPAHQGVHLKSLELAQCCLAVTSDLSSIAAALRTLHDDEQPTQEGCLYRAPASPNSCGCPETSVVPCKVIGRMQDDNNIERTSSRHDSDF